MEFQLYMGDILFWNNILNNINVQGDQTPIWFVQNHNGKHEKQWEWLHEQLQGASKQVNIMILDSTIVYIQHILKVFAKYSKQYLIIIDLNRYATDEDFNESSRSVRDFGKFPLEVFPFSCECCENLFASLINL